MSDIAVPRSLGDLLFVKWGGSLITDKARPQTARPEVLRRLAGELTGLVAARPGRVVLGHGSGSFGHTAADRFGVADGVQAIERLPGVSRTQHAAARLHRMVVETLLTAGAAPFSIPPGSAVVSTSGRPATAEWEPVWRALALGMLPVVHGDVVLDRERGSAIVSTETVLVELARALARRGEPPPRVFWLGVTDGVWDDEGRTVARIGAGDRSRLDAVGGSDATDVTGGMRHRLEAAFDLLALGAESWILDGRQERVIERVLAGDKLGTRVGPGV